MVRYQIFVKDPADNKFDPYFIVITQQIDSIEYLELNSPNILYAALSQMLKR